MAHIGYHASHEQFTPGELVEYAVAAERAGFASVMSSDHLAPWSKRQGQSGFTWTWLGAAMQATTIPFGLITVPIGFRYHPIITAQAAATLADLFPGRFPWMAVGSGQALNEHFVAKRWPSKQERNELLLAGVEIIRELWSGAVVSHEAPIAVDEGRLYSLPRQLPRIIAGALSPETAEWAGHWADGLITVNQPREKLKEIIEMFRNAGGEDKPLYLQVHVSFAATDQEACTNAFDQWRSNAIKAEMAETLRLPEEFDAATEKVRPDDMDQHVRISSNLATHAEWLLEDFAMGFEEMYVHNVGRNQMEFIDAYSSGVLPNVMKTMNG
jgi:coenzyme F420-dependent glucose-6-phosphate dehydrogenase